MEGKETRKRPRIVAADLSQIRDMAHHRLLRRRGEARQAQTHFKTTTRTRARFQMVTSACDGVRRRNRTLSQTPDQALPNTCGYFDNDGGYSCIPVAGFPAYGSIRSRSAPVPSPYSLPHLYFQPKLGRGLRRNLQTVLQCLGRVLFCMRCGFSCDVSTDVALRHTDWQ